MATFQDYLNSLGAKPVGLGYSNVSRDRSNDMDGTIISVPGTNFRWEEGGGRLPEGFTGPKYNYGDKPLVGGKFAQPGYIDSSGGFLGYGANPDQLTNPTLLRGYSDFIAQDPAREAQQIANRQATQDLFEQQLAARQQTALTLPQIRSTPQQQAPVSPMGGWGQPTNQPTTWGQPITQPTGVLGGGLHRGSSGGMGMLSGGLHRGSNQ